MKAFWLSGGLQIRPESDEEWEDIRAFLRVMIGVKELYRIPTVPGGSVEAGDEDSVVAVEPGSEVPVDQGR